MKKKKIISENNHMHSVDEEKDVFFQFRKEIDNFKYMTSVKMRKSDSELLLLSNTTQTPKNPE